MDKVSLKQFREILISVYTQAVLKLDTQTQQREAVVLGQSLSPYRLRYISLFLLFRQ
ncbi:MAG: hypothetical protein LBJ00_10510 [Planctomycetaceae bacterium]|nr:hypothetical protein [Planctomycetaceae bacterium]